MDRLILEAMNGMAPESPLGVLLGHLAHQNEVLEELSEALHMMGANQSRAMVGQAPAYLAEDFGFNILIPRETEGETE